MPDPAPCPPMVGPIKAPINTENNSTTPTNTGSAIRRPRVVRSSGCSYRYWRKSGCSYRYWRKDATKEEPYSKIHCNGLAAGGPIFPSRKQLFSAQPRQRRKVGVCPMSVLTRATGFRDRLPHDIRACLALPGRSVSAGGTCFRSREAVRRRWPTLVWRPFGARRSRRRRKSAAAIPRREFGLRDRWRASNRCRCMPRLQASEVGTTRGGSARVKAEAYFPPGGAGRRTRVGQWRRPPWQHEGSP